MKLLVFGSTGQVACELHRLVPEATFLSRAEADLSDPPSCSEAIALSDADVVINAAAYTAVDRAESDEEAAELVNGAAPAAMARTAAAKGIPFLHISTDYVFHGGGTRPWQPDDDTTPLGAYGRSKLAGEHGIRAAGGRFVILRTSWVFSAFGSNFVKTIRRLGQSRDSLNVVADQIGGPTAARDIAATLVEMARQLQAGRGAPGIYHYAGEPDVSWADFAREIYRQAGLPTVVNDIPTAAYPTPAQRPLNSRLDCSTLQAVYGIVRPDWRASLSTVLDDLGDD